EKAKEDCAADRQPVRTAAPASVPKPCRGHDRRTALLRWPRAPHEPSPADPAPPADRALPAGRGSLRLHGTGGVRREAAPPAILRDSFCALPALPKALEDWAPRSRGCS